jgi:hypothetical protein
MRYEICTIFELENLKGRSLQEDLNIHGNTGENSVKLDLKEI